jgi:ElaB/YqjD/DUF883 family membrane-anchored ribosome-binding protein
MVDKHQVPIMPIEALTPDSPTNGKNAGTVAAVDAPRVGLRASVSREFHDLLADIEQLIGTTTTLSGAELAHAKAQLGERINAARQSVDVLGASIDQQARKAAGITNDYVHAQPWNAIAIGAGVGLLLGFVLAHRGTAAPAPRG